MWLAHFENPTMAELFVINGIRGGMLFPVPDNQPVVVGRVAECHIHLPDPWISSSHARFEVRQGHPWLVDLGSSNGTFVSGARIQEARLTPGTQLRFGKTEAEFRTSAVAAAAIPDVLKGQGTIMR